MKRRVCYVLGAFVTAIIFAPGLLPAQVTAFTYQGRLDTNGQAATGSYDFQFRLYDAPTNGGQVPVIPVSPNVAVSNGLFTTGMDFGSNVFNGTTYYLEIAVQPKNGGGFTTLSPRQVILPVPGAIFASSASNLLGTVPAAQLSGTLATGSLPASPNFSGTVTASSFSGSGANVTSLNAGNISSGTLADGRLSANAALLNRNGQTFSGSNNFGDVTVTGNDFFGASTRQMLNLWGTQYGIGVQGYRLYFRTDNSFPGGGFAWFQGGSHDDFGDNPGPGGVELMQLLGSGLTVNGSLTLADPATIKAGTGRILFSDAHQNFFAGPDAGKNTTNGFYNTANGYQALFSNNNGVGNTAEGFQALKNNTDGGDNSATGYKALYSNIDGNKNVANGEFALYSNTGGFNNTAIGYAALYSNVNGSVNTAQGFQALYSNTSGFGNVGNGYQALYSNTNGIYSTACGYQALYSNPGDVGSVAVGYQSLYSCTNGTSNTGLGYRALQNLKYGGGNLALGYNSGANLTNGDLNIYIGTSGVKDESNVTRIANIYNTTIASGVNVLVSSSGQLGTITSSERFKQNIQSMDDASDVLLGLRPVKFQYKPDLDPEGIPQFGLIAEEVEKVDPELVARDDKNQIYTVRYQAVSAMLLNEFLKQHKTVANQTADLRDLGRELEQKETEITDLKQKNESLEKRLEALEKNFRNLKSN